MLTDLQEFTAFKDRHFQFREMHDAEIMKVWEKIKSEAGSEHLRFGGLNVRDVNIESLKKLQIWDGLSPELQKEITEGLTTRTLAVHELMEKARAGRKNKYINVPKFAECVKCHSKVEIAPRILVQKAEKIAEEKKILYTVDDYLKTYECRKCKPVRRGRQSTGKCLPVILTCKCGSKVSYPANILLKRAEKKGMTVEKFKENFSCQICNPSPRGRPRKIK